MPGDHDLRTLLKEAVLSLTEAGIEEPVREARLLLQEICQISLAGQLAEPQMMIEEKAAADFRQSIEKRSRHIPFAYIVGEAGFYGREFLVENCLIPRPETELLIDLAKRLLTETNKPGNVRILDLCTGSGCVGISLYLELKPYFNQINLCLSDISEKALKTCYFNCLRHIEKKSDYKILHTDLLTEPELFGGEFDLIAANPPYIKRDDLSELQRDVRDYEPSRALNGGADGLDFYRRIAVELKPFLRRNTDQEHKETLLIMEHGLGQSEQIARIFEAADLKIGKIWRVNDLQGYDRVIGFSLK